MKTNARPGMKYLFYFSLFFIASGSAVAQQTAAGSSSRISDETVRFDFYPSASRKYEIAGNGRLLTSIVIRADIGDSLDGARVVVGNTTYEMHTDDHLGDPAIIQSVPVVFEAPASTALVTLPGIDKPFTIFAISAEILPTSARTMDGLTPVVPDRAGCEEPAAIDQAEWRSGLSAPSYTRSFTETAHLIVHHSATSNSLTDYYNVVRNIYLYHTQVNGWSDIGYNYLIAPDGTIFKGRDPGTGEQDLVLGAHFCGRNTTTMGVCMLGDYRSVEPTEKALRSLESLLAWKATRDDLDVFGVASHPLNDQLPTIAGHRQGCATECPGAKVFEKLPLVRQNVDEAIQACKDPLVVSAVVVYPNPAADDLMIEIPEDSEIEDVEIMTVGGQLASVGVIDQGLSGYKAVTGPLQPGVYVLKIKLKNRRPEFKRVILE